MKKLVATLLFIFLSSLSFSSSNTALESELIDNQGLTYKNNDTEPFTGKAVFEKNRSYYLEGRPHGKWITFYPNGNIKTIENWKYGKLNGKFIIYSEDGKKLFQTTYLNGHDDGDYYIYHENGKLRIEGKFVNGTPAGEWKYYDKKGRLTGKNRF